MTLRRTAGGLASLHLFFRSEIVVFCEGGHPLSTEDVLSGLGEEETLDALFWSRIAAHLNAKRSYHFKSVGSKATLKSIADDVSSAALSSIVICLDRDYDWHCGRQLERPNVIYSYGYSWENDVVCPHAFDAVVRRILGGRDGVNVAVSEGLKALTTFSDRLVKWCEIEIALALKGSELVLPRSNPVASIDMHASPPCFCNERVQTKLEALGYSRGPRRVVSVNSEEALRHCWGKLCSRYIYHLFMWVLGKSDPSIRVSYDLFMRLLISEAVGTLKDNRTPERTAYFSSLSGVFS